MIQMTLKDQKVVEHYRYDRNAFKSVNITTEFSCHKFFLRFCVLFTKALTLQGSYNILVLKQKMLLSSL